MGPDRWEYFGSTCSSATESGWIAHPARHLLQQGFRESTGISSLRNHCYQPTLYILGLITPNSLRRRPLTLTHHASEGARIDRGEADVVEEISGEEPSQKVFTDTSSASTVQDYIPSQGNQAQRATTLPNSVYGNETWITMDHVKNECRVEYLKFVQDKTSVFEHRGSGWKRATTRDIRPMSTSVLDPCYPRGV